MLDVPTEDIQNFENGLFEYIDTKYPELPKSIREEKVINEDAEKILVKAIEEYKKEFVSE